MKLNVTANLKFGSGKVFMKGVYEGEIPQELIAEMKSGSRYISEVDVPNVRKASPAAVAARKKKAAEKRKVATVGKKKAAAEEKKAAAGEKKAAAGEKKAAEGKKAEIPVNQSTSKPPVKPGK